MAKIISLGAKIKDKLSVPSDSKGIRVALLVLSFVSFLLAALGILIVIYAALSMSDLSKTSSEMDGLEARMSAVGLILLGLTGTALMFNIYPCYFGYCAARQKETTKVSIIIGLVWAFIFAPLPSALFAQIVAGLVSLFPLAMPLFLFLFLPYLWTALVATLVPYGSRKDHAAKRLPLKNRLKNKRNKLISSIQTTESRKTITALLCLSLALCIVFLIIISLVLKFSNAEPLSNFALSASALAFNLGIISLIIGAILLVWCIYITRDET